MAKLILLAIKSNRHCLIAAASIVLVGIAAIALLSIHPLVTVWKP